MTAPGAGAACLDCGAAIDVMALAQEAALGHCEGGDEFTGGELCASCPSCGAELRIDSEGYTEWDPQPVVEKAVVRHV